MLIGDYLKGTGDGRRKIRLRFSSVDEAEEPVEKKSVLICGEKLCGICCASFVVTDCH